MKKNILFLTNHFGFWARTKKPTFKFSGKDSSCLTFFYKIRNGAAMSTYQLFTSFVASFWLYHIVISIDKYLILRNDRVVHSYLNNYGDSRHLHHPSENNSITENMDELICFNDSFSFNITSIKITMYGSINTSISNLDLLFIFIVNNQQYLTENLDIHHQDIIIRYPSTDSFQFIIFTEYNISLITNKTITISIKLFNKRNVSTSSQIDINQIDLSFDTPSELILASQSGKDNIPDDVTIIGKGALVPYQILHDQHANDTEKDEIIKTLSDAIVYVFNKYGFSNNEQETNTIYIRFDDPMVPREKIINNNGDMVVKFSQYFYEKDEEKVMNFTISNIFETEINEYFHEYGRNDMIGTSTIFILQNEIDVYWIWSDSVSIWSTPAGIALIVVVIIIVLSAIIIAGACLHCRKRREDFETTLPKSKAHKERVEEMLRKKAIKKMSRRNLFNPSKYKAIRQQTDDHNEQIDNDNEMKEEVNIEMGTK